jgi:lipoprotein Spr
LAVHHKKVHYLPVDPEEFANENNVVIDPDTLGHIYYSKIFDMPVDTTANMKLFHTVENWIGTPYRLGGASHWGIDCSQFAKKLYSSVSNSLVGQTCREIIGRVQKLTKVELKPGDFVFFKIHGPNASHMGVYLGGNKFVHSSTSKGVMISSLNDPYFEKHFLVGGRAIESSSDSPTPSSIFTN